MARSSDQNGQADLTPMSAAWRDDDLLTAEEAAAWLRVDPLLLNEWRRSGGGPAHLQLPSGGARYRFGDLKSWTQARRASPWMTTPEAALYVRLSRRTLEDYRCHGGGPRYSRPSGNVVRYHRDDLDSWIRERTAFFTTQELKPRP
jgi:excisionase family DNA binding protein